jgi:hypothetical protein
MNKNIIKYKSVIEIGDKKIKCYILEDGRRILDAEDLHNLLGVNNLNELNEIWK